MTDVPFEMGRYRCLERLGADEVARVYRAELLDPKGGDTQYVLKRFNERVTALPQFEFTILGVDTVQRYPGFSHRSSNNRTEQAWPEEEQRRSRCAAITLNSGIEKGKPLVRQAMFSAAWGSVRNSTPKLEFKYFREVTGWMANPLFRSCFSLIKYPKL